MRSVWSDSTKRASKMSVAWDMNESIARAEAIDTVLLVLLHNVALENTTINFLVENTNMHVTLKRLFGQEVVARSNLRRKVQHHEWHGITLCQARQIYRIEAGNWFYVSFFIIYKYSVFHRFIARLACMKARWHRLFFFFSFYVRIASVTENDSMKYAAVWKHWKTLDRT